jgi:type IV pilus assembly protein PilV
MNTSLTSRHRQSGAYLLEALIGILIFGLGILGIVGLQAASLRTTADSSLRAEAVLAANQLIGQMWTDDQSNLAMSQYSNAIAGQPYKDFAAQLKSVQGGAWVKDPSVIVDGGVCNILGAVSKTSHVVAIEIWWQSDTGEACSGAIKCHNFTTCGVVGENG